MSTAHARVWQRAAVYGSLWAAVEIIVGSFLHNLRIPFAGSILAAFGVMVMTAGHRASPERGLIWRAALICALMKSISPSAVILGPMIGIAMEGVLLETSVRLLGGTAAGYVIGGALAVSWSMVQRVANALIAFGPDVVRLYVEAYAFASRSLGVSRFGPFDLIATLVVLEWVAGATAAVAGISVGRAAAAAAPATSTPGARPSRDASTAPPARVGPRTLAPSHAPVVAHDGARQAASMPGAGAAAAPTVAEGSWSLPRLALVSTALLAGLIGLSLVPLWLGAACVAGFAAFVLRTYPRAARRIRRPSLWIELAVVMLLAGLLLGGVRHGVAGLAEGLIAGAAMVLRATMVLFGFTAISVELRNPVILSWVERRRLRGLSDALGVAFGTLPAFTSTLTSERRLWRHPAQLVAALIRHANTLVETRTDGHGPRACVILTGNTGSGKTTLAREVIERLRQRGLRVGGIVAPGQIEDGRRTGFDILNLATGESTALARETPHVSGPHARWSRFAFSPEGLALGHRALGEDARGADVIIVDEVGPFELSGGGWAAALDALARTSQGTLLLVVRESIVDAVRTRWGSTETVVCDVGRDGSDHIADLLSGDAADTVSPRPR